MKNAAFEALEGGVIVKSVGPEEAAVAKAL